MSDTQTPRTVLLALDSTPGLDTLETALKLALQLQARLEGLFVEDTDLLRLATLPFAQEILSLNAQLRPFASDTLEQAFKSQALQLQRQLAREAEARQLQWGFSVVQDRLLRAARNAASNAALYIVQSPRSPAQVSITAAIGVVYTGLPTVVDIAAQLAQGDVLRILMSSAHDKERAALTQRITTLGAHPVFITLRDERAATISEVARHQRLSLLILPDTLAVDDTTLQPLLESAPCTVVVKEQTGN